MLRDIQVGVDFLHSDRSCDVVLEVVVDDREALEAYQNHPYHVDVVKSICTPCGRAAFRRIMNFKKSVFGRGAFFSASVFYKKDGRIVS